MVLVPAAKNPLPVSLDASPARKRDLYIIGVATPCTMPDPPTVTGIFTIRNAIEAGYPFAETITAAVPLVDEFLINDGGSDDGTRATLDRFEAHYDCITLYDYPDFESEQWEVIDTHLERLIEQASGDWLFEVQGDELHHERDIPQLRQLLAEADADGYNSLRQPRLDFSNRRRGEYIYWLVRFVKNVDDLRSYEGGDNFQIGDRGPAPNDYTTHNVPPELKIDVPLYHFPSMFDGAGQTREQHRRHAEWLATDSKLRHRIYNDFLDTQ